MTPETTKLIEQAANSHNEFESHNIGREYCSYCAEDFKDGATHVLNTPELMREEMEKLLIFANSPLCKFDDPKTATEKDVVELYLEHLKQQR